MHKDQVECPNYDHDDEICKMCLIKVLKEATTKYGYINVNCNYNNGSPNTVRKTNQNRDDAQTYVTGIPDYRDITY